MNKLDLKITLRQLYRQKLYSLTNILGLAVAIACTITLGLYVYSELSVDSHHTNTDRVVRIVGQTSLDGETRGSTSRTSRSLGPLFTKAYPQVGEFVRFQMTPRSLIKAGDIEAYRADMMVTDPNIFSIFSHSIVYGDPDTALANPDNIAISQSMSHFYFGEANPLGEILIVNDLPFKVSLVFSDIGTQSHLRYNALFPLSSAMNPTGINVDNATPQQLFSIGIYTYLFLNEAFDKDGLQGLLDQFYDDVMADYGRQRNFETQFWTQDLSDIYLDNSLAQDIPGGTGNFNYVMGLFAIAIIILLVACINYGNQATALATQQANAIQLRRLLGGRRWQIALQYCLEAQLTAFLALFLGLMIIELVGLLSLPLQPLSLDILDQLIAQPSLLLGILGLTLCTGFLAGIYPAIYLSHSAMIVTYKTQSSSVNVSLRQALVFFQFFIAVGVLSSTVVVNRQMQYLADQPLGYDSSHLISVNLRGANAVSRLNELKNRLLNYSNISGFSTTSFIPPGNVPINRFDVEKENGQAEPELFNWLAVGPDFLQVMDIKLREGRDFPQSQGERALLVNETLANQMNWNNALGKRLNLGSYIDGRVVGVVEDFHFDSLRNSIQPLLIQLRPTIDFSSLSDQQKSRMLQPVIIRFSAENVGESIRFIESTFTQLNPGQPFEYWFFDEGINDQYWQEQRLLRLISIFSVICVAITMVGLIGLIAFTTEQRTKEIGIRRVLGATLVQLLQLLGSKSFSFIVIAGSVASIVSFNLIQNWLNDFTYRVPVTWHYYTLTVIVVSLVTLLVIAYQCARMANKNPVEALRYE